MQINMSGKTVIVTGAISGIGAGIVEAFLKNGANVVATYLSNNNKAETFYKKLSQYQKQLLIVKSDVTDATARNSLISKCFSHFNGLDILVNNAGILNRSAFVDMTEETFQKVLNTNLYAPYFLTQEFAKNLISRKAPGAVVNISSINAFRTTGSLSHYEISKAGVSMFTKSIAAELAQHKIRVNSVSPGMTRTNMNRHQWEEQTDLWQRRINTIPLKRAVEPEDIASAVLFLASDVSISTSGADLVIDGAFTTCLPWFINQP